jgi:outer membrane protein assembly factor BamB
VSGAFPLYTRPEDVHYIDQAELTCTHGTLAVTVNGLGMTLPTSGEKEKVKALWVSRPFQENVAVALAANAVIVAGIDRRLPKPDSSPRELPGIVALDIRTGNVLWKRALPAGPVRWGVAIDRHGRVLVSLRDGGVLCLAGEG